MTRAPRNRSNVDEARVRSLGSLVVVALAGAMVWCPTPSARAFAPEPVEDPELDEPEQGVTGSPPAAPASEPGSDEVASASSPTVEEAPDEEPRLPFLPTEPPSFPVAYSERPLNLPRFHLRAGGTLRVYHYDAMMSALGNQDTSLSLSLGGSFAVTDWLEFGVLDQRLGMFEPVIAWDPRPQGLVPLALTPDLEFGDIPVHARLRLVADPSFDASMDIGVVIPVTGDLAIFGAMVVRARLTKHFTADSGLNVTLRFDRDDRDPHLDLFVPFSALIQLHPSVFLAVRTAVRWTDFDHLAFPLGVELGYTVASGDRPLMDIRLGFGMPALITPNDTDHTHPDVWQVTLAGHVFFAL